MINQFKRWLDRNNGLHDAADVNDAMMTPPPNWKPVEVPSVSDLIGDDE